jgi:hypothetical protein
MQEIIVAVIVLYAALAVLRRYAPVALRKVWRAWLARTVRRFGWTSIEKKLIANTETTSSCADGCGACKGCAPIGAQPETHRVIKIETLK